MKIRKHVNVLVYPRSTKAQISFINEAPGSNCNLEVLVLPVRLRFHVFPLTAASGSLLLFDFSCCSFSEPALAYEASISVGFSAPAKKRMSENSTKTLASQGTPV